MMTLMQFGKICFANDPPRRSPIALAAAYSFSLIDGIWPRIKRAMLTQCSRQTMNMLIMPVPSLANTVP